MADGRVTTFGLDDFADWVEPATPAVTCRDVYARFTDNPDLMAIPVIDDHRPIGLVHRTDFMMRLAHSYGNALYARKSVTSLMDADPMVVDRSTALEQVQATIADHRPGALAKGFLITDGGRYVALGTALSLIRHSLAQAEQRSVSLRHALAAAESASAAKSSFLATMSHELRTPLNAVIGFSELITGEAAGPLNPNYLEYGQAIREGGEMLLSIVTNVLDYAKTERTTVDLHEQDVDLAAEGRTVGRLLARQAERAGLTLLMPADHEHLELTGDARLIRQMLVNLVGNGIKFTPRGGQVEIRASIDAAGSPCLSVRDTGCGMSDEEIVLALEPFRQINNGLNRKHEGTGLGLPLVAAFAHAHQARLVIESARNRGTTARIEFPAARLTSSDLVQAA